MGLHNVRHDSACMHMQIYHPVWQRKLLIAPLPWVRYLLAIYSSAKLLLRRSWGFGGKWKKSVYEVSTGIFSKGVGERLVSPICPMAGSSMTARAQRKVSMEGSSMAQSGFLHPAKERAVSHQAPSYNRRVPWRWQLGVFPLSSQDKVSLLDFGMTLTSSLVDGWNGFSH